MDSRTIKLVARLEKGESKSAKWKFLESVGLCVLPKLEDLHREVVSKVKTSFDSSVAANNTNFAEELFKIFPVIHERDIGLSKYGAYLASKIGENTETQLALVASGNYFDKPNVHVDLMTQLLELVAQAIQANESVIQQSYGISNLIIF